MKSLIPSSMSSQRAKDFLRSFSSNAYYVVIGDHVPNAADTIASEAVPGEETHFRMHSNLIQGKKVDPSNVKLMIPRFTWASNTVVEEYSHLAESNCHVVVESGNTYNVYKCLDNNNDGYSTTAPTGTDAAPFTTADGYVWKYMFGVDSATFDKFKTTSLMPFVANTTNQSVATPSSIDVVQIINGGVGYGNYFEGQLRSGDITSPTQFKLIENASNIANFYRYCIIKITNPDSPAYGEFRRITAYSVVGAVKTITVESAFSSNPVPTDTYEIYPEVEIISTGSDATPAVARAIINPLQSNTVSEVEVLTVGQNHRGATATVLKDASVTITTAAELLPIISPAVGHGGDPVAELGGSAVEVWCQLEDADTALEKTNEFRQFALIRNPRLDGVVLTVSGTGFANDEQIIQYQRVAPLSDGGSIASTTLTGNATSTFTSSLRPGDSVLVANATAGRVATVASVTNTTTAVLTSAPGAISASNVYLVRLVADGMVESSNSTSVTVSNVSTTVDGSSFLYGVASNTMKTPSAVSYNGKSSADNLVLATRLVGTMTSGTIQQDETLVQGDASCTVYSVATDTGTTTVYVTNVVGNLTTGAITGQTSGAVMNISAKYNGDFAMDQGQVVYLQNVAPVTREPNKNETFKIVLES